VTALALQEHVSIGSDGSFLDEAVPKPHCISLGHAALHLSIMYHRVAPSAKAAAAPAPPTADLPSPPAGSGSSVTASAPSTASPGHVNPASAAHHIVKPNRFPKTCSFSVQADRSFSEPDCLGAHVLIRGDPALLCIGAELEICSEHAADCFGKVVACSLSRAASVYTLDVEVFRHVVYLPCSPQLLHANLTEVFHIFIEKDDATKSPQLLAAIARRTTAAAANHDAAQRAVAAISATKERAKELASKPIRITVDQLGMVRLRQSFLVVQPLISEILMRLMQEWQPDAAARAVEYKKAFHSSDGPWDVFSVFSFLLRRRSFAKLIVSFGVHTAERDKEREELESILELIYAVRNWWAHVSVAAANCRQALVALRQFIALTPDGFKPPVAATSSVCGRLEGIERSFAQGEAAPHMTIDDISYFYFGRASRHLSLMCTSIMEQAPASLVSVYLSQRIYSKDAKFRQHGVVEVVDVTRALLALNEHQQTAAFDADEIRFDCETIRAARNNFAHAPTSGNRVIMVLLALGSLSRIISVVCRMCAADDASAAPVQAAIKDASTLRSQIQDWQVELLQRAGMTDVQALIDDVCEGHRTELHRCEYATWATDNYRRLRLLTKSQVVGAWQAPANVDNMSRALSKEQRALLNVVARVPPASRSSSASAADWLLSRVKNCEEPAQNDHMQELVRVVQKAVSQDAQVQRAFTPPCSADDTDTARASVIRYAAC
jgi:hypothetical protein